jgi:hypothetical protein
LDGDPWRPQSPAKSINGIFLAGEDRWATPASDITGAIALPHRKSWSPGVS